MDDPNPYEAPMHGVDSALPDGDANHRGSKRVYLAWIAVFVFNMALPLLFGWSMTEEHGRIGMSVAAMLLLTSGCWVCAVGRRFALPLIAGAALVAITQLFPILQIIAGMIGMGVAQFLGGASLGDDTRSEQVGSEFGGFVVTFVTGGILMGVSIDSGMLIQLITPDRLWWRLGGTGADQPGAGADVARRDASR